MDKQPENKEIHYLHRDSNLIVAIPSTKEAIAAMMGVETPERANFVQKNLIDLFESMNKEGPFVVIIGRDRQDGINIFVGHKSEIALLNVLNNSVQGYDLPLSLQHSLLKLENETLDFCMQQGNLQPINFAKGTFTEQTLLEKVRRGIVKPYEIHESERTTNILLEGVNYEVKNGISLGDDDQDFLPTARISLPLMTRPRNRPASPVSSFVKKPKV